MGIIKNILKKKDKKNASILPTLEEAAEKLYGQNTNFAGYEIIKTIYSLDKTKRYHILKSENGFYKYTYEEIYIYDEDELSYICNYEKYPAFWMPSDILSAFSFYGTEAEAMSGLTSEAEYNMYFKQG